ncbi:MAG: hypothetical protein ABW001_04500 [Mycobacterium sp.]
MSLECRSRMLALLGMVCAFVTLACSSPSSADSGVVALGNIDMNAWRTALRHTGTSEYPDMDGFYDSTVEMCGQSVTTSPLAIPGRTRIPNGIG